MGVAYDRGRLLYQRRRYAHAADELRRELSADAAGEKPSTQAGFATARNSALHSDQALTCDGSPKYLKR